MTTTLTILDRLDLWAKETLNITGEEALTVAVDQFYVKTVAHEQLKKYFADADLIKLKKHQVIANNNYTTDYYFLINQLHA